MPVEVVSYMLSSLDPKKCLQFQIVLWCAPFLKGMKTASAVNIKEQYCPELEVIMADNGISFRSLVLEKAAEPISISQAFPKIFERKNAVNVTI